MNAHGIKAIDMVVVNLYPFEQTVAKPDCTLEDAIENIDIGGPTMVRAAAKNHAFVNIVVNASDYATILDEMESASLKSSSPQMRALIETKLPKIEQPNHESA